MDGCVRIVSIGRIRVLRKIYDEYIVLKDQPFKF